MADLVDTNVLVYRFDPRFPLKQERAEELLKDGIENGSIFVPYQALVEFVAAVTRPIRGSSRPLLSSSDAHREVEDMLVQFRVLYPTDTTLRIAVRGAALYGLSWFDACLWAYADEHGIATLWSEDFQNGRLYGRVKVSNPFELAVHDAPRR